MRSLMFNIIKSTAGSLFTFLVPTMVSFTVQLFHGLAYLTTFFFLVFIMSENTENRILVAYVTGLIFVVIAYYLLYYTFTSLSLKKGYALTAALRLKLARHLRTLPLSYFRKKDTATLSGHFLHDMLDTEAVFSVHIYDIIAMVSIVLVFGTMFLCVNVTLGVVVLVTSLIAFPVLWYSLSLMKRDSPKVIEARALADGTLLEYLKGIGELKATGMTGKRFTPWGAASTTLKTVALAVEIGIGKLGYFYLALLECSFLITMAVAAFMIDASTIELTTFLFFMLLWGRYYEPMHDISILLAEFRYSFTSVKKIADTLQEPSLPVMPGYEPPQSYEVAFQQVHFSYGAKKILQDFSFTIPEGTVTALVGESGSGKTTTANLLLRFMDVDAGRITIGGTDIRTFSQEELYKHFSVVFQEVYLFNDTIMNNIRLARPEASDEEVMAAARKACCHDFIIELEEQYQTSAGEKGARLSGGERQRIAIARAILKNAPLLILDEATASIDPENELLIQQGLTNLTQGKTLLVIAHRLSTIQKAHQILVLNDRVIAERGTHDELIAHRGVYENLWAQQNTLRSWSIT